MNRLILGLAFAVGCGAEAVPTDLRIYVEANSYLTGPLALEGCRVLEPLGITCTVAVTNSEANTWIRAQETLVGQDAAYGQTSGQVTIAAPLFFTPGGGVEGLIYAVAHELGHRVGMVDPDHVPACDQPHETRCGVEICGDALMSAGGPDRVKLTPADLAFWAMHRGTNCP